MTYGPITSGISTFICFTIKIFALQTTPGVVDSMGTYIHQELQQGSLGPGGHRLGIYHTLKK